MGRLLVVLLAPIVGTIGGGHAVSPPRETAAADYRFRQILTTSFGVTHIAAPPSGRGRLFVVQQDGRIRLAVNGRFRRTPFLDIRPLVEFGGERGLLSMTFHPAYARNGRFYVDYIARNGHTKVVEYRRNRDGTRALPRTARTVLDVAQPGVEHKGGQLAFGPDGKLYVSLGDGECCDDPANRAQDMRQLLGKLIRLDATRPRPPPEIIALGLRNPWRFAFDRANGDLYIADVGAGLYEEIDFIPRGELGQLVNFGWDAFEGPAVKEDKAPSSAGRLRFPIHAYNHDGGACSITGGFVYRGSAVRVLNGRYVFGDYCTGAVWSLRVVEGRATDIRQEAFTIPQLSTFGQDARGELYAASHSGRIYRLVP